VYGNKSEKCGTFIEITFFVKCKINSMVDLQTFSLAFCLKAISNKPL
jgi:hypothetical protein